jgi:hypothetical protein
MAHKDPERIEEAEINKVVVCIMSDHATGRMRVGEIRAQLPNYARLSSKDYTDSETRNREHLWEQQVRNLKSHEKSTGNIFCEGYVEWISRGIWEITDSGRLRARHLRESGFYNPA